MPLSNLAGMTCMKPIFSIELISWWPVTKLEQNRVKSNPINREASKSDRLSKV